MRRLAVPLLCLFFATPTVAGDGHDTLRHDIHGVRPGMDFDTAVKVVSSAGATCEIETIGASKVGPHTLHNLSKSTRCTFGNGAVIAFSTPRFLPSSAVVAIDYFFHLPRRSDFDRIKKRYDPSFFGRCATPDAPIEGGDSRNDCILSTADAALLQENADAARAAAEP